MTDTALETVPKQRSPEFNQVGKGALARTVQHVRNLSGYGRTGPLSLIIALTPQVTPDTDWQATTCEDSGLTVLCGPSSDTLKIEGDHRHLKIQIAQDEDLQHLRDRPHVGLELDERTLKLDQEAVRLASVIGPWQIRPSRRERRSEERRQKRRRG